MSRIRWNAFANLGGTAWSSFLAIALVPLYLRHLGIEAYALVGIFTIIQTSLVIFEFGLGLTLTHGMARLSVEPHPVQAQRDLMRTVELVYWSIAVVLGAAIYLGAEPIARHWIHPSALPSDIVVGALQWMGVASALQFPISAYKSALMGVERQVLMNTAMAVLGTIRAGGAVAVLVFFSPTITAFLAWQTVATLGMTITFAGLTWHALQGSTAARFRSSLLRNEWPYTARVSVSLLLNTLLSHLDKVLLSTLLPLAVFGYYSLAWTVAAAPWFVTVPMNTAVFPRLTQLFERRQQEDVAKLYHTSCQLMAVLVLPGVALLSCFSGPILRIWTGNPITAANTSLLLSLLVCGTALISLASGAGYMAAAGGRPQVMTQINMAAVVIIVPAMTIAASRFGAVGAALVWVGLGLFHFFGVVPLAHHRLLRGEMWRWYVEDILEPALAIAIVVFPFRLLFPLRSPGPAAVTLAFLVSCFVVSTLAGVLGASQLRALAVRAVRAKTIWTRH